MDGLDSSFNFLNGRLDNSKPLWRRKLKPPSRPDYELLWRTANHLVGMPEPMPEQHIETWVEAHDSLENPLLYLMRHDSTPPGDTKTEQRLIEPALEAVGDFLKLYAEVLKQSPPDDLQMIEQVLRHRRESLNQLHPLSSPKP